MDENIICSLKREQCAAANMKQFALRLLRSSVREMNQRPHPGTLPCDGRGDP